MRWSRTLTLVEAHAEGEVGKMITGGVVDLPGATMLEKMDHLNQVDDSLRRLTIFEPRGCVQMSVNLMLPPTRPEADAAFIVLQADRAHAMSGSNCMCVVTALLETGVLPMTEPTTRVVLDTPAGLVGAVAQCRDGKCERVTLDMVPSFVDALDIAIDVDGLGSITADIAFGGVYYALVDVGQTGLEIEPGAARDLVSIGMAVKRACAEQVRVQHPELSALDHIAYVMFRDRDAHEPDLIRHCTTLEPGRCDRSPCGTGSSANLAVLYARGEIAVGQRVRTRSIIGSEFQVELAGETEVAGRPAVLPRITGRAWLTGIQQIGVDPTDPFPLGFTLSDTWGENLSVTD